MGTLEFIKTIIQMCFALGVILLLILATYKLTSKKVETLNSNKYVKVLERIQISKDAMICVVKIGNRGQVISVSHGKVNKLEELSEEEVIQIEENKRDEFIRGQEMYKGIVKEGKSLLNKLKPKDD